MRADRKDIPLLDVKNLNIEVTSNGHTIPIVQNISLTLKRGEVLGIIGESGAGKSTLGLAAIGFLKPGFRVSSGDVLFRGEDLLKKSDKERRSLWGAQLSYVAQSATAAFNPAHRLMQQTIEPSLIHGMAHDKNSEIERAEDLFGQMRLPDPQHFGDRYPHQASGGQLQRAMTAMAMMCRPDIIVFDEPTTALDVTTQVEVLASIRRLVEENGTAALYISHDLAVVSQMAHRIMVMRHGRLVEEANTSQIVSQPEEAYTRSLWSVRSLEKAEEPPAPSQLSVQNVSAHFGELKVLDDIKLDLPIGRTVALVGESGSGKSTLARTITGLLKPSSGQIVLNDKVLETDFRKRSLEDLRRVQMVYQSADTALNPRLKVIDLIGRPMSFYFGIKGRDLERRVADILDMVEMSRKYLFVRPGALSGGQKQRVAIARAIAADPDIFICDEITSALDQLVQEQLIKLLLRLQKELNKTYLFISHDIATVNAVADFVAVMHRGKIVQQGPRSDVLSSPGHPYTQRLLESVPQIDPGWLDQLIAQRKDQEFQFSA